MSQIVLNGKKEAEKMTLFLEESERLMGKSFADHPVWWAHGRKYLRKAKGRDGRKAGVLVSIVFAKKYGRSGRVCGGANSDETVDGILVQLPILGASKEESEQILYSIKPEKDVDGLNPKSKFIPAAYGRWRGWWIFLK